MTGSFSQNAARKPSGTEKHHIAPIFPCISNFASPPAQKMPSRTVVLTDCAIKFRPQKRSMYCRYSAAVSVSGAKWTIAGEINIRRPPVTTPMAIARCVRRPPYSRAFSSSSAPSRFPIRTPAPPLTPRIRQERRLFAIEVIEFAATASLPMWPMITEYRT